MIDAYATMVSERLDEEHHADSRRDLEALHRGAARARLLVETLLNDGQSQGRELRQRPIDLNLLVRECVTLLAPRDPHTRRRRAGRRAPPHLRRRAADQRRLLEPARQCPQVRSARACHDPRRRRSGGSGLAISQSRVRGRRSCPPTASASSSPTTGGAASDARRAPALDWQSAGTSSSVTAARSVSWPPQRRQPFSTSGDNRFYFTLPA